MAIPSTEVTHLLQEWSGGDRDALDKLIPLVIDEVRDLARRALSLEARNHTLQPTELVDEAYVRLVERKTYWWQGRIQFFVALAELMRRILVDHARRRDAAKRGGGTPPLPLEEGLLHTEEKDPDLLALHDALEDLKVVDPRKYQIVMLSYFIGLTQEEIASELSISVNTVGRALKAAKLWLRSQIQRDDSEE